MMRRAILAALTAVFGCCIPVRAQDTDVPEVRALIVAPVRTIAVGKPVWLDFTVLNDSDQPVRLTVPGTKPDETGPFVGLPISHIFSGKGYSGLTIESVGLGRSWDVATDYQPPDAAPQLLLAPHSSVGARIEASRYYPQLTTPGRYRLQWQPYDGTVKSNVLLVEIAPLKQAIIQTDFGDMTIDFFYEDAPEAVANFIELARSGFYNGLTFHRIEPGYLIQGGDPNGDGTGIRPDGKKLPAEFSDRPQTRGMLSMARLKSDPDSASCQFFICNTRMPEWDGKYTIFGQLTGDASYETLDKLMAQPAEEVGDQKRPVRAIVIRSIRIVNAPDDRLFGQSPTATAPG